MTFSQRRNVVTFSNFVNGVYDVFTEYFIANFYRKIFKVCILLMRCIVGSAVLLGGLLFSRSASTILQLVVGHLHAPLLAPPFSVVKKKSLRPLHFPTFEEGGGDTNDFCLQLWPL